MKVHYKVIASLTLASIGVVFITLSNAYQGPVTPHFDGSRFLNPGQTKESSVGGYLWLRLTTSQAEWPVSVPLMPVAPPPPRVNDASARVTWVGHATLLIQVAGLNILTDPIWSARASPFSFAGPKRVTPPGVSFAQLPPIDVVLISHDHYDHLDLPTLQQLDARDHPRVIVPLGNRALVAKAMPTSEVTEHDWGEKIALPKNVTVHVEPMLHASGRSPFDQLKTLWAAFVIEANNLKIYHVGDAGYGDGRTYKAAAEKFGSFDLAILPIGAYAPEEFMADSHMSPVDAVKAKSDARATRALAHHYGTFQLGFEAFDAPLKMLQSALVSSGVPTIDFAALLPGEAMIISSRP
jgi:L-ascorbate metabolism protein UlaG (beta-lactamase superfamily)